MGNQLTLKIADKIQHGTSAAVQAAIGMALKEGVNGSDSAYIGAMGALGGIIGASFVFAKKPEFTDEEVDEIQADQERGELEMAKLLKPEIVQFTALVASCVMSGFTPTSCKLECEMGPDTIFEALQMWEKLNPDKKAEDYLDNHMLIAARTAGANSEVPFNEFLEKRKTHEGTDTHQ